jgi:hypothetical protein
VAVGEEQEGMASLWALLSATDARSCFQWLTRIAQGCGTQDPRGMDARRADLMVGLLTGTLTHAPPDTNTDPDEADSADTDTKADTKTGTGEPGTDATDDGCRASEAGAEGSDTEGSDTEAADTSTGSGPAAAGSAAGSATGSAERGPGPESTEGGRMGVAPPRPVNPGKPLVHVLMPFTTLLGLDEQACELAGHGPIPAELAREIAADATLKRLVYDPLSGALLDHGRTTYRPPAALADFVRARDLHCRGPICNRRALDSELDHIIPYPKGPTSEKNLMGGCGHDHHAKHAPGWQVRARPRGRIEWITPTGHRYCSDPHDYRPDAQPPPPPATTPPTSQKPHRPTTRQRDEITTALWDGEKTFPPDPNDPAPF